MTFREKIAHAQTFLFVPGDRPERFAKAVNSGADVIILDLEDAVADDQKNDAREAVADWLTDSPHAVVRINAAGTSWHREDLAMISAFDCAVMVPKSEEPFVCMLPVIPLIETAAGILNAVEICRGTMRPAFGSIDLAAQLRVDPDDRDALATARSTLVLAAAAAGVAAPIDGVTTALSDSGRLADDVHYARRLGFTGKLCIHPSQIAPVHHTLAPTAAEITWAERIVGAAGGGAIALDGSMVDKPVIERARRILGLVTEPGLGR
ncbi:HpcH/HpaI aldolase/citrate lyase family protein [Smaragdicoccus niigatensis]|uniref:HpcH/HpaI aldolase/citrate lyase family protein n=1 Tax=Smaragdicoccus niigatensis TaxID=359359 RepID=UPI00036C92A4|nr:CoA ester lyase [Smaragdicoccus niigatensis]